jgi:hypothetical protein
MVLKVEPKHVLASFKVFNANFSAFKSVYSVCMSWNIKEIIISLEFLI